MFSVSVQQGCKNFLVNYNDVFRALFFTITIYFFCTNDINKNYIFMAATTSVVFVNTCKY